MLKVHLVTKNLLPSQGGPFPSHQTPYPGRPSAFGSRPPALKYPFFQKYCTVLCIEKRQQLWILDLVTRDDRGVDQGC